MSIGNCIDRQRYVYCERDITYQHLVSKFDAKDGFVYGAKIHCTSQYEEESAVMSEAKVVKTIAACKHRNSPCLLQAPGG
jgi:hypothetical protein